jgi:hypothetical protein
MMPLVYDHLDPALTTVLIIRSPTIPISMILTIFL